MDSFSGDYGVPKNIAFESKLDTDLYEFAKNKTYPISMSLSPDGKFMATIGEDKKIRVFRFLMGKLYCVIDEWGRAVSLVSWMRVFLPAVRAPAPVHSPSAAPAFAPAPLRLCP